jgi:hypothetical protein
MPHLEVVEVYPCIFAALLSDDYRAIHGLGSRIGDVHEAVHTLNYKVHELNVHCRVQEGIKRIRRELRPPLLSAADHFGQNLSHVWLTKS